MAESFLQPFNFKSWIGRHAHLLKPPVSNKLVFENTQMVVQVVGGPNQRVDFHDDPVEEFFYQLKGDMILKIAENGGHLRRAYPRGRGLYASRTRAPLPATTYTGVRRSSC